MFFHPAWHTCGWSQMLGLVVVMKTLFSATVAVAAVVVEHAVAAAATDGVGGDSLDMLPLHLGYFLVQLCGSDALIRHRGKGRGHFLKGCSFKGASG